MGWNRRLLELDGICRHYSRCLMAAAKARKPYVACKPQAQTGKRRAPVLCPDFSELSDEEKAAKRRAELAAWSRIMTA